MRHPLLAAAIVAASFATSIAPAAAVTFVAGSSAGVTSLGTFGPGTYTLSATGIVDLAGDGSIELDANGVPITAVTNPNYLYFNPSGSFIADGIFGPGGTIGKIGALLGTLSASPVSPADFFLIGSSTTVTLASTSTIYGLVNDTFYPNNTGGFSVDITAVPEPATWAMLIIGFGLVGGTARRRRTTRVAA